MRLKVFFVPYLCLISSLVCSPYLRRFLKWIFRKNQTIFNQTNNYYDDNDSIDNNNNNIYPDNMKRRNRYSFIKRMQFLCIVILVLFLVSQNYASFRTYITEGIFSKQFSIYSFISFIHFVHSYHSLPSFTHSLEKEFYHKNMEDILTWIEKNTSPTDVFISEMAVSAHILLSYD